MKFKGLTNIGKRHLAKIHANNGTLEFTKIKFGDGTLKANEEPLDLVQVKNFKIEQEILGAEQNDNITSIETVIDNLNITYGFHVREFGIYAKDGNDEILYYYMNDDTEASWMPPASDGPHKMEIKINMVMSNTASVVVNTEDHDLYLTKSYFLKRLAEKMNNIIQKTGFNLHKSDSVNSNDTNILATSLAVKTAHDKATEALNIANTKEPSFSKRTGHNLDKTDEYNLDDTNKLATAKALKKLFDEIIKRIGAIKLTWSAITGKPNFSSSVSSNTENEFATPKAVKTAYDKGVEALNVANTKLNISYCPYRVGDIYTTTSNSNPATIWIGTTWQKIEGRFLRATISNENAGVNGGSDSKTLTLANLPSHNHSASAQNAGYHSHEQAAHSHGRGDMEISGRLGGLIVDGDQVGAFKKYNRKGVSGDSGGMMKSGFHGYGGDNYDFAASRAWSGNTSSAQPSIVGNGSHTHPITIGNTGSGAAFDIKPAYITVHIWKRIS